VLGALLEVKSTVASILKSAQRLGIQEATTNASAADDKRREQGTSSVNNNTSMTDQPAARHHPHGVAVNLASTTRHEGLTTSLFQRRQRLAPNSDISSRRSNRIQIKYRKT
jgi:hypothetical protein